MTSEMKPYNSNRRRLEEEEEIKVFASQMLTSRVFLGNFQERRHVDLINNYRDVVVIDQQHGDLMKDLDIVRRRLDGFYKGKVWIGITDPNMVGTPSGHSLWVKLNELPLGQHWFLINRVTFQPNEVIIKLKQVRMPPKDPQVSEQIAVEADMSTLLNNLRLTSIKSALLNQVIPFLSSILTYHNFKETVLFLSVLVLAVVTGALSCLQYLGDFTLRLLRELNGIIRTCTPFMMGVLDLIAKVIGGLYLLLAMMWQGSSAPPMNAQKFMAHSQQPQLALPSAPQQPRTYAGFKQRYQSQPYNAYNRQYK